MAESMTTVMRIAVATAVLAIAGCSDDTEQLRAQIEEIKARPGGRIEPLPEVKPYETFAYPSADQRSPVSSTLCALPQPIWAGRRKVAPPQG